MSGTRDAAKKMGGGKGKPGDLAQDVARLAEETGLDTAEVYAFLCGGAVGSSGGVDWMDRRVQAEARKYLPFLY